MLFIINQWAKPIAVYFTIKKEPIKYLSKIPISPTLGFSKLPLTALFKNTWILKFKSQLMLAFFTAVNHLSGSLRKQKFVIGDFDPRCVSLRSFFACDRNYVDGSQKHNCEDSFWTSVFGSSSFIIYYWVYYKKKKRKKDHLNRRRIVFSPYRRRTLSELTYATGRKREEDSKP